MKEIFRAERYIANIRITLYTSRTRQRKTYIDASIVKLQIRTDEEILKAAAEKQKIP